MRAAQRKERIPGGLASGRSPSDFDPRQLAAGIRVEMEHTDDRAVAQEIAMDHLSEDRDYYKKLRLIEKCHPFRLELVAVVRVTDEIWKARTHKYILRVPTGKPRPKWRYYYRVPGRGVVGSHSLREGASFRSTHEHEGETHEGHWRILSHTANKVRVKHTGSGRVVEMGAKEFAEKVNAQHAKGWEQRRDEKVREIDTAMKVLESGGGGKTATQVRRVERLIAQAEKAGWISKERADKYRASAKTAAEKRGGAKPEKKGAPKKPAPKGEATRRQKVNEIKAELQALRGAGRGEIDTRAQRVERLIAQAEEAGWISKIRAKSLRSRAKDAAWSAREYAGEKQPASKDEPTLKPRGLGKQYENLHPRAVDRDQMKPGAGYVLWERRGGRWVRQAHTFGASVVGDDKRWQDVKASLNSPTPQAYIPDGVDPNPRPPEKPKPLSHAFMTRALVESGVKTAAWGRRKRSANATARAFNDAVKSGKLTPEGKPKGEAPAEAKPTGRVPTPKDKKGKPKPGQWPSIDHGLLSPSGKISARERKAALERERERLFGKEGLKRPQPKQEPEIDRMRRRAKELRGLAERGMKPRAYRKEADRLEARANELEGKGAKPEKPSKAAPVTFTQEGVKYVAEPAGMSSKAGKPMFHVHMMGKRGKPLAKYKPATREADGSFKFASGKWLSDSAGAKRLAARMGEGGEGKPRPAAEAPKGEKPGAKEKPKPEPAPEKPSPQQAWADHWKGNTKTHDVKDGYVEAPHYESHRRGKNWTAVITPHRPSPGGLKRDWVETVRGRKYFSADGLKVGDVIEHGADYYSTRGRKHISRRYSVVVGKTDEGLVLSKLYETAGEAFKSKKKAPKLEKSFVLRKGKPGVTGPEALAATIERKRGTMKAGPGGHVPDGSGPPAHGRGEGPGAGRQDGSGQDLDKSVATIRRLFDEVFGAGSYAKLSVPKAAKRSKAKHDINVSPDDPPEMMGSESHARYVEAKRRLADWAGTDSHYGQGIASVVRTKLDERQKAAEKSMADALGDLKKACVEIGAGDVLAADVRAFHDAMVKSAAPTMPPEEARRRLAAMVKSAGLGTVRGPSGSAVVDVAADARRVKMLQEAGQMGSDTMQWFVR